jgi:beta-1,4-mannosyltransferase
MSAIQPLAHLDADLSITRTMRVLAWPIDPANPYTVALYSNMKQNVQVDEFSAKKLIHRYAIWHIHWPESLLNIRNRSKAAVKVAGLFAAVDYLRWRGAKIVWTIHNLKAHDELHPALEANFWRRFIPRVDGAISLSETALSMARAKFPALHHVPTAIIPHGHYRDEYPQASANARDALGISSGARVILFFGTVRPYKNVEALVRAFRKVTTPGALLYVVGRPNSAALTEAILKEARDDDRIRLAFGFVKDEDVSKFMQAADLVVLPYKTILNSGSALLALTFNRPVLVRGQGSMGDLRRDFGDAWVKTFSGTIDAQALEQGLEWTTHFRPAICQMPEKYDWRSIGSETVRFYERVVFGNGSATDSMRRWASTAKERRDRDEQ